MIPPSNPVIREAIRAVSAKYCGSVQSWLTEKNPVAMRQLDAMAGRIDAAALAGDDAALRRSCLAWKNTWLFWIQNYRMENRKKN